MNDKRKKRILFYYMQGASAGGSDTCLYLLLKYLDESKFDAYLLYRDHSIYLDELSKKGINLIPIPDNIKAKHYARIINNTKRRIPPEKKIIANKRIRAVLSEIKIVLKKLPETIQYSYLILKNRIDCIHTNQDITSDRQMVLSAILMRKKLVCHNRGSHVPKKFTTFISKYMDKIICMSDFSKSIYIKNGVPNDKCVTIYDGIDYEKFIPSPSNDNNIIISCIGRLEKWKGQEVLVDAAEILIGKIPEVRFLLIGDGSYKNELILKIMNKKLENYFEFTGHITNVRDYIRKSTLIVHTSIEPEPFGMVIIESMALEKPVIATNFGGPLEIIEHKLDGFLIPPKNPFILAESILKLVNDPLLRNKISYNARQKVITRFDVKKYAQQIEEVYENIFE